MDAELGEVLTRWSVRLAVVCYLSRVLIDGRSLLRRRTPAPSSHAAARWLWTFGFGLYALHVMCAFTYFHDWSHASAYRHTAEQTARITGLDWGVGLYVNYAFSLLWMTDAVAWWVLGLSFPYRKRSYLCVLHIFFAFMVFNATVVFGPPIWRILCVLVAAAVLIVTTVSQRFSGSN